MSMNLGMNMSQRVVHRQEMRPMLTVQMIQSVEMLQLPLLSLQEHIQQEVNSNPVLEIVEGDENADSTAERPVRDDAEKPESPASETDGEAGDAGKTEPAENFAAVADYDFERRYGYAAGSSRIRRRSDDEDRKFAAIKATPAPERSLHEELEEQVRLSSESERLKQLAMMVIGNLSPDGYLRIPLDDCFIHVTEKGEVEYSIQPPPSEQAKEEALFFIQSLEPTGVGARSLQECLAIQLRTREDDYHFEEQLINEHLEDLAYNRLKKVAHDMGVSIERIKLGLEVIRSLNPHPGGDYGNVQHQYIVPDVIVERVDGNLIVRIVRSGLPSLRVNKEYAGVYRSLPKNSKEREFLRNKMQSARWLIDSVRQRHETLRKISEELVKLQRPFFDHGITQLKPLMMQEIADRTGMHVSTVSRAIADKYMQTPRGLVAMRELFTSGFENHSSGGEMESNRAIMERIRCMIEEEDKRAPLSDEGIMKLLKEEGIEIARRTVAKYREKMGIPSSRRRKEY